MELGHEGTCDTFGDKDAVCVNRDHCMCSTGFVCGSVACIDACMMCDECGDHRCAECRRCDECRATAVGGECAAGSGDTVLCVPAHPPMPQTTPLPTIQDVFDAYDGLPPTTTIVGKHFAPLEPPAFILSAAMHQVDEPIADEPFDWTPIAVASGVVVVSGALLLAYMRKNKHTGAPADKDAEGPESASEDIPMSSLELTHQGTTGLNENAYQTLNAAPEPVGNTHKSVNTQEPMNKTVRDLAHDEDMHSSLIEGPHPDLKEPTMHDTMMGSTWTAGSTLRELGQHRDAMPAATPPRDLTAHDPHAPIPPRPPRRIGTSKQLMGQSVGRYDARHTPRHVVGSSSPSGSPRGSRHVLRNDALTPSQWASAGDAVVRGQGDSFTGNSSMLMQTGEVGHASAGGRGRMLGDVTISPPAHHHNHQDASHGFV